MGAGNVWGVLLRSLLHGLEGQTCGALLELSAGRTWGVQEYFQVAGGQLDVWYSKPAGPSSGRAYTRSGGRQL